MSTMNIGEAAAAAGVTPKMIRHYESLGLIPAAERTESGYRVYTKREVDMLRFVRQARSLGFPIPQVEALLRLWRDDRRESRAVKEVARAQLAEIEQRRRELDEMSATLSALVEDCAGDEQACCPILERLSSPLPASLAIVTKPAATLKEVKPGTRTPQRRERRTPQPAPAHSAHASLVSWTRSFAGAG